MYILVVIVIFLCLFWVTRLIWKQKIRIELLEIEKNKMKINMDLMTQWTRNCLEEWDANVWLENKHVSKVAIYGAGNIGRILYYQLQHTSVDVLYFIDRNAGKIVDDLGSIISLGQMGTCELPDMIVVTVAPDYERIRNAIIGTIGDKVQIVSIEELIYRM